MDPLGKMEWEIAVLDGKMYGAETWFPGKSGCE